MAEAHLNHVATKATEVRKLQTSYKDSYINFQEAVTLQYACVVHVQMYIHTCMYMNILSICMYYTC